LIGSITPRFYDLNCRPGRDPVDFETNRLGTRCRNPPWSKSKYELPTTLIESGIGRARYGDPQMGPSSGIYADKKVVPY
jgi:hypothetical protein